MTDEDRKRIMAEARANIAAAEAATRDHVERLARLPLPDPLVKYRAEADAVAAAEREETRRRIAASRADQRQRARDAVESASVAELRAELSALRSETAQTFDAMTEKVFPLLEKIGDKQAELERLLNGLHEMSASERGTLDLPSLRFRSSRNAN